MSSEKDRAYEDSNMLTGNVNRMFVCDSFRELERMREFGEMRLKSIYEYNKKRLEEKLEG